MRSLLTTVVLALTTLSAQVGNAALVYSDSFNRATLAGGTYSYTTTVTAGDGAASISGGDILQFSNDGSGAANESGRVYVTTPTSAFGAPYNSQLDQNSGLVSWTFNMRQIRTDPGGFNSGSYGAAFVLGASSADLTVADGYAVVLGQSGATDPIRLVAFTGGLDGNANLANIISGGVPLSDVGADYLSLQVTYDPTGDAWSLSGRNDGASSFSDPTTGTLSFAGGASDGTYAGTPLTHLGFWWNYDTLANQTAFFDNVSITAVSEPTEWGLICALGLLGICGLHTWRERRRALRHLHIPS
jgi:hypothetical protein